MQFIRRLVCIGCALWVVASPAAEPSFGELTAEQLERGEQVSWRRTVRGWENRQYWRLTPPAAVPQISRVHPSILAALQLLISLAALLAFPAEKVPPLGLHRKSS